jgi:hypothetical protein
LFPARTTRRITIPRHLPDDVVGPVLRLDVDAANVFADQADDEELDAEEEEDEPERGD